MAKTALFERIDADPPYQVSVPLDSDEIAGRGWNAAAMKALREEATQRLGHFVESEWRLVSVSE
jgi:hypothetical protein